MHYSHPAGAISNLKLIWVNWYYDPGTFAEVNVGNTVTVTASIEYPLGVFTQVTFTNGSTSGVMADGGLISSDITKVVIPAGTQFWVRTCFTTSSGNIPICVLPATCSTLGTSEGNSAAGDLTMSGTIGTTSTANTLRPIAIIGNVAAKNAKAYILAGDSIVFGEGDITTVDAKGGSAYLARALANKGGYTKICKQGQGVHEALSITTRLQVLLTSLRGSYTDVVCEYGVNDLRIRGDATQLKSELLSYLGFYVGRKNICTLTPRTDSSDSWVTTGNQTQKVSPWSLTNLNDVNDWMRSLPKGIDAVVDAADAVMSARDSGVWAAITPGKTTDGTHPTSAAASAACDYVAPNLF